MTAGSVGLLATWAKAVAASLRSVVRMRRERLIIFTRYPEPGKAKTRLIPVLGPDGAAELQRRMTAHVLREAGALVGRRRVSLEVRFEGGSKPLMRDWLGFGVACSPQDGANLGERMERAFADAFRARTERVVIVGSDCPGVTANVLESAFRALAGNDLVLGPATDGGYYLIGLRRRAPELFDGPCWGTDGVLRQTLEKARAAGLSVVLLAPLDDVDRPEDLPAWERIARSYESSARAPRISVIVPALNEAANIAQTLATAQRALDAEIIVVDGGSEDDTAEVARSCGVRLLSAARGRARQMNAGAAAANGDYLLFLHADTRLPWGYGECVRRTLSDPGVVAGAFLLGIDGGGPALRMNEHLVNCRARYLGMPYGDQAIFIRARTFREIGGFPHLPIMEDYELMRRLRRRGRVAIVPVRVLTSGRRWTRLGVVRATLVNKVTVAGYRLGVSPDRLAAWYRQRSGD